MMPRRKKIKLDYNAKKYANPFFQKRKPGKKIVKINRLTIKQKLSFMAFVGSAGALFWLFYFSPVFRLKKIEVRGPEKISVAEVESMAWNQAEKKRLLLAKQQNIFIFDEEKLAQELNSKYALGELKINKILPSKVIISLKEKNYSSVWHESDKYYLICTEDKSATEIDPLEVKDKNMPLIENLGDAKIFDNKIFGEEGRVDYILHLLPKLKDGQKKFEIEKFTIDNKEAGTIKVVIKGPVLLFNLKEDMDKQLTKLYAVINEKLKEDFTKKSYIDLRYGDKIYYQ